LLLFASGLRMATSDEKAEPAMTRPGRRRLEETQRASSVVQGRRTRGMVIMETDGRRRWLAALVGLPLGLAALSRSGRASAAPAAPAANVNATVDALASAEAIRAILYRYARANDRKDEALMRSCFWPESTHKHGGFEGSSSDFVGRAMSILGGIIYSTHFIANPAVELRGDRAFSECYYAAHHRRAKKDGSGEEDAFFEGRYIDFLERRRGEWRIIRRRGLSDLTMVVPAPSAYASWTPGIHSHPGQDDEYFAMRKAFLEGK